MEVCDGILYLCSVRSMKREEHTTCIADCCSIDKLPSCMVISTSLRPRPSYERSGEKVWSKGHISLSNYRSIPGKHPLLACKLCLENMASAHLRDANIMEVCDGILYLCSVRSMKREEHTTCIAYCCSIDELPSCMVISTSLRPRPSYERSGEKVWSKGHISLSNYRSIPGKHPLLACKLCLENMASAHLRDIVYVSKMGTCHIFKTQT